MHREPQFSNLIYEYFYLRIRFQYYKYGDTLPSIETLCHEFSVSALSVKTALRRLRGEGYIAMQNGKSTTVRYHQTEEERDAFISRYFSERWNALPDLYASGELLYIPLMVEGMRRMDDQDLDYISQLVDRAAPGDLVLFYAFILQKTQNPLVMNLFWETSLFQGFLYVRSPRELESYDVKAIRQGLRTIISCRKAQDWDALKQALIVSQREAFEKGYRYIQTRVQPVPEEAQVTFVWRIYRERPQRCYSLASTLLYQIYMGEFQHEKFLPSYEKMAEKYDVSLSTMRRTVKILNQIGAVRSINGKGTRIFSLGERSDPPDFENPIIRRNLSYFVQSYEIIIHSCQAVTKSLLTALTQEKLEELIEKLEELLAADRCTLSLWHYLIYVFRYSPLRGVREIYQKIFGLFLWGYPLRFSCVQSSELDQAVTRFTQAMIKALKAHDIQGCAEEVNSLLYRQFLAARDFFADQGISPEDLRLAPTIRLMLTET